MTHPKIYPVACPERDCKAPVGEPCKGPLTHVARSKAYVLLIHQRAAEARGYRRKP